MATIDAARALGLDGVTGSLSVDKEADIVAIDLDYVETQPLYDPVSQIVYSSSREQVTDVWVAGKQLLRARDLITINSSEVLAKAKDWRVKIYAANSSA